MIHRCPQHFSKKISSQTLAAAVASNLQIYGQFLMRVLIH